MVGAHLPPILMCQFDVAFKFLVDAVASFRGLQLDIGHVGVVADDFPKHITLIMADVNAVDVGASVLALHNVLADSHGECKESEKQDEV